MKFMSDLSTQMREYSSKIAYQGLHIGIVESVATAQSMNKDTAELKENQRCEMGEYFIKIPSLWGDKSKLAKRMLIMSGKDASMFTPISKGTKVIVGFLGTSSIPIILGTLSDSEDKLPKDINNADSTGAHQPFEIAMPDAGNKIAITNGNTKAIAFGDNKMELSSNGPSSGYFVITTSPADKSGVIIDATPFKSDNEKVSIELDSKGIRIKVKETSIDITGNEVSIKSKKVTISEDLEVQKSVKVAEDVSAKNVNASANVKASQKLDGAQLEVSQMAKLP